MKIRPVGIDFLADRRTDVTKLIVAFRNFANAPNEYEWADWVGLDQIWFRGGLVNLIVKLRKGFTFLHKYIRDYLKGSV